MFFYVILLVTADEGFIKRRISLYLIEWSFNDSCIKINEKYNKF